VPPIAAVIFDFDGLLMATESTMLASWQYEWRQHGLELDTATFWADHGGDVSQERYRLLAEAVGPPYDRDRSHARRLAYRDRLHADLDLAPGLAGWLAQAAGLRCIAIPNPHADPARFGHADLILASAAEVSLAEAIRQAQA
jgi:beta-phosphoglucomutase-like phosphatase (HAD superfamily)